MAKAITCDESNLISSSEMMQEQAMLVESSLQVLELRRHFSLATLFHESHTLCALNQRKSKLFIQIRTTPPSGIFSEHLGNPNQIFHKARTLSLEHFALSIFQVRQIFYFLNYLMGVMKFNLFKGKYSIMLKSTNNYSVLFV